MIRIELKKPVKVTWIGSVKLSLKIILISRMSNQHTLFVWGSEDGKTNINSYAYDYLDKKSKEKIKKIMNK